MPSESAPRKPHTPVRIGKYEVTSHIATGGMGAVYRARDTETGGEVALKVLTPEMAAKPAMVERFRREARSTAKLRHENIVKVFEFGEHGGTCYIAMEFVDGCDLMAYIDDHGPLDPEETRQIMIQACRALKTAHEQGIVHRDIKPSNFLVTRKNGRIFIKLTDLGLAREANADDFRVTRSGTTVGTVDYMAPEQARDSGLADTRSDLYALGCTWFHMLTNQPPFPDGGLAERIVKHMQTPPPDVRDFNPRASKALAKILNRLLEKKQIDRYQTPADLLDDLLSLDPVAPVKVKKAKSVAADTAVVETRGPRRSTKTANSSKTVVREPTAAPGQGRGVWIGVGVAVAAVLLAGASVAIALALRTTEPTDDNPGGPFVQAPPSVRPPPAPPPTVVTPPTTRPPITPPPPSRLPALYEPRTAMDWPALRARIDAPWANVTALPDNAPILHVSRVKSGDSPTAFTTVAEACAAAPAGQPVVIEIDDNGPLYQSTAVIASANVFLRAGKGFRPLLVWDVDRTLPERKSPKGKGEPVALFQVDGGSLTLDGIDVVLKWLERTEPAALLQVTDGDLDVNNCTFSVAGKHPDGVAWVRFRARKTEPTRCRLRHCYARGGSLVALQLDAPNAEVLLDGCLIAGGEPALVQVSAGKDNPANVRIVRSTLVTANTLLSIQPVPADNHEPALRWLAWDTLLSRCNEQIGGEMVTLPDKTLTRNLRWEAFGTLYAGWKLLLGGSEPLGADDRDFLTWGVTWDLKEGDKALGQRFPATAFSDPAQLLAAVFATATTPVSFASTYNREEPLGCPLGELPPARDSWLAWTFERFPVPEGEVLDSPDKPPIEQPDKTAFHGARLDLTAPFDLGAYLQEVQKTKPLGPRVVLHLTGTGEQKTSPIRIKGSSLVLYFEPPTRDDAKPLSLSPQGGAADALVKVEDGNLDVINGEFTLPDGGKVPNHIMKVSGGDLRLYRCRLQAPHSAGDTYTGLIDFQGSGATALDKARACLVNQSVLSSGHMAIDLHGVGARVLLRQSVVVAGDDVLHVEVGPGFVGRANVQCLLEQSTLAAKKALVHFGDITGTAVVQEPAIVQTLNCACLNPFAEAATRPGLLRCDGEALARAAVVWQSEGDFLDKRLAYGMVPAAPTADAKNGPATWPLLWGTVGVHKLAADVVPARQFDANTWTLERLAVAVPAVPPRKKPGADLTLFGVDKKNPTRPL